MEERVEEKVDERALNAPGNDLLLPIPPLLRCGFEDVFPAPPERLLVLAVEDVARTYIEPIREDETAYSLYLENGNPADIRTLSCL